MADQETCTHKNTSVFDRELRDRNKARIDQARLLEAELHATAYGVWGHLTGSGAREYVVFKANQSDEYLIVVGRKEDGTLHTKALDPLHTPNKMQVRSLEDYLNDRPYGNTSADAK